ncbi:uncharacterized protein JCM10292_005684 [Rhodotorula paludigena]|uniref:uncharacterized protein n=1 Tax=Rhodotorula paludigena TaxID=86838 RepID=UPI00316D27F3
MADPIDNPAPQQEDAPARVTKRKITDALSSLDAAFKDPVAKAKRRKATTAPTSTAALEAILARTKARASTPSSTPAPPSYEPTSLPALLSRLATYRLSTFSPSKPASLSSLSCALHGWVHTQSTRERVQCVTCGQGIVLLSPSSGDGGWTSGAGKKLREEYERLVQTQGHAETCPWRLRPCARSLYRLASGGLGVSTGGRRRLLEEVAKQAREMDDRGLAGIALNLPSEVEASLATESMAQRLNTALAAVVSDTDADSAASSSPSTATILLALFGWTLLPSSTTPSLSRSASASSLSSLCSLDTSSSTIPILHCAFCTRQVLATSYLPSQQPATDSSAPPAPSAVSASASKRFDPLKQHQPFCPYVDGCAGHSPALLPVPARANAAPTAPLLRPGWQVRLSAVLQRPATGSANGGTTDGAGAAMVEGGAAHSQAEDLISTGKTKELLLYVRNLLGPKGTSPASMIGGSRGSLPTAA